MDQVEVAEAARKDGLPRSSFAYTPTAKPESWKLPYLTVDGAPDPTHLPGAAAALSAGGFRGQPAEIPDAAMPVVKAKLRSAYRRWGKAPEEWPESIREDGALVEQALDFAFREEVGHDPVDDEDWLMDLAVADSRRYREASDDGHFFGPWRGGSKASGGGPASEKGKGTATQRRAEMAKRVGAENVGRPTSLTRKLEAKSGRSDEQIARDLADRAAKTTGPVNMTKEEVAATQRRAAAYQAEHADAYKGNPLEKRNSEKPNYIQQARARDAQVLADRQVPFQPDNKVAPRAAGRIDRVVGGKDSQTLTGGIEKVNPSLRPMTTNELAAASSARLAARTSPDKATVTSKTGKVLGFKDRAAADKEAALWKSSDHSVRVVTRNGTHNVIVGPSKYVTTPSARIQPGPMGAPKVSTERSSIRPTTYRGEPGHLVRVGQAETFVPGNRASAENMRAQLRVDGGRTGLDFAAAAKAGGVTGQSATKPQLAATNARLQRTPSQNRSAAQLRRQRITRDTARMNASSTAQRAADRANASRLSKQSLARRGIKPNSPFYKTELRIEMDQRGFREAGDDHFYGTWSGGSKGGGGRPGGGGAAAKKVERDPTGQLQREKFFLDRDGPQTPEQQKALWDKMLGDVAAGQKPETITQMAADKADAAKVGVSKEQSRLKALRDEDDARFSNTPPAGSTFTPTAKTPVSLQSADGTVMKSTVVGTQGDRLVVQDRPDGPKTYVAMSGIAPSAGQPGFVPPAPKMDPALTSKDTVTRQKAEFNSATAAKRDTWVAGAGGTEMPQNIQGQQMQRVFNPKTGEHGWLHMGEDRVYGDKELARLGQTYPGVSTGGPTVRTGVQRAADRNARIATRQTARRGARRP